MLPVDGEGAGGTARKSATACRPRRLRLLTNPCSVVAKSRQQQAGSCWTSGVFSGSLRLLRSLATTLDGLGQDFVSLAGLVGKQLPFFRLPLFSAADGSSRRGAGSALAPPVVAPRSSAAGYQSPVTGSPPSAPKSLVRGRWSWVVCRGALGRQRGRQPGRQLRGCCGVETLSTRPRQRRARSARSSSGCSIRGSTPSSAFSRVCKGAPEM